MILEPKRVLSLPILSEAPENPHIPCTLSRLQRVISDFPSFEPARKMQWPQYSDVSFELQPAVAAHHSLAFVLMRWGRAESPDPFLIGFILGGLDAPL